MKSPVGVRELKAHLSAYLRAVARGATVVIHDRARQPIAKLVPAASSRSAEILARLVEAGIATRGVGKPGAVTRVRPRRKHRTMSALVVEDRR